MPKDERTSEISTGAPAPPLPPPVFHDPRHHIKIYQGDCLDILAAIHREAGECIDLIFADPPYFLSNGGITCHAGRMVSVNKGAWDKSRGPEENHQFILNWLAACQRVLKPNGSIWVSGTAHVIHSVGFAMQQLGFKLLNDISWVKPNPPPNLSCRYFTHATETIIWAAKNKKSRHTFHYKHMKALAGGKQMKSVWHIYPPDKSEKRFGKHPTQKPLALLERILLASSNPGDLVLDPFLGSGTTAIAALRLRRFFCGIEVSAAYLHLALCRIGTVLIAIAMRAEFFQIDLDPPVASVDRSGSAHVGAGLQPAARSALGRGGPLCPPSGLFSGIALQVDAPTRLIHRELKFFFVGADQRAVVFSVVADSLEDAWRSFRRSPRSHLPIFSVIKTETEIYLL